jgi:1-acyl-sn-glycerol-3-phosphate acyltransferase
VFYRAFRSLFRLIAALVFRFRVEGVENVPLDGPGVVVAPHRSWLDPACVGGACPRAVRFLIMERVWRLRWANWWFRGMQGVPVGRGSHASLGALREAIRALDAGQLVGVFPEGRVLPPGRLGRMHAGAALLAVRVGAPVIPVVIDGSSRAWPHGRSFPRPARVRVRFGEPIAPPAGRGRQAVQDLIEQIEEVLQRLAGGDGPA